MSEDLAVILQEIKGQRLIFVSGNFNVIHPRHLRLLRFARGCGEILVVGVHSNTQARSVAMVDELDRLQGECQPFKQVFLKGLRMSKQSERVL